MQQTVRAERLVAGGEALGRLADGRVVFVPGLVPGETATVQLTVERRDFARASIVSIDDRSPDRVDPPCEALARGCGGCDWQHLSTDAQQHWKVEIVRDALRRTARLPDAPVRWGGSVQSWAYRTSLRVASAPDGRLGLRAAASDRVVPLRKCPVAVSALDPLLESVRLAPSTRQRAVKRARGQRPRRDERDEVTLRVSVASGMATVAGAEQVCERLEGVPVGVSVGDAARLSERVGAVALEVSAGAFFQSGPQAAELLVSTVRAMMNATAAGRERAGVLVDAYGGIGLFAATLGWERSVVIESSPVSCDDARRNLGAAGTVVCSPFERWEPSGRFEVMVADPARAGLGAEGANVIDRSGVSVLVLVSCDPVAMARDVAALVGLGFSHRDSVVLDLFPQTHHVEVVTLLER